MPEMGSTAGAGFGGAVDLRARMGLDAVAANRWTHELWREVRHLGAMPEFVPGPDGLPLFNEDGSRYLAWREVFDNLVVTTGLNKLLDATLKTGLASPAWYIGLVDNASFTAYAAGDTMASHGGWLESSAYSNANRPTFTTGTIASGSVDNSASKGVFNINATATIRGSFLADNNTKGGTTGTLYGEGDYAASRSVVNGDTLNVQITCTVS